MIMHSIIVLFAFFSCLLVPCYIAAVTMPEDEGDVDPRDVSDKTDTFFLKG